MKTPIQEMRTDLEIVIDALDQASIGFSIGSTCSSSLSGAIDHHIENLISNNIRNALAQVKASILSGVQTRDVLRSQLEETEGLVVDEVMADEGGWKI